MSGITSGNTGTSTVTQAAGSATKITDGTDSVDVLPLSTATALAGPAVGLVGWVKISNTTTTSSGTTTAVNITGISASAIVGDMVYFRTGANPRAWAVVTAVAANALTISPALPAATANADTLTLFRPAPVGIADPVNTNGNLSVNVGVDYNYQNSTANGLLKLEDAAHTSGDAGVFVLGVNRGSAPGSALSDTLNDYTPIAVNSQGGVFVDVSSANQQGQPTGLLKLEDSAAGNADAVVAIAAKRTDTLANQTSNDGDYTVPSADTNGVLFSQPVPLTTAANGTSSHRKISAASNNATNVKGSAGTLYSVTASNINAAIRYVKFYDKATAPSVGSDTPVLVVPLPPSAGNACVDLNLHGMQFTLGIGYGIVTGAGDSDNTSTAANEQFLTITYK